MTWSRQRRVFTPDDITVIRQQYESGLSTRDIARTRECSFQTISKVLRKAGVTLDRGARIAGKKTGNPSGVKGFKWSADSRQRLSAAKRGKPGRTGYRFTDEQRAKLRAAQRLVQIQNPTRLDHARSFVKRRDPIEVAANKAVRTICKSALRRVLNMARRRKDRRLEEMLGYSKAELRAYIQSRFKPGMCWTDRPSFHVDHIVPIAAFFRHGIEDPRIVNALSNLQPLGCFENQSKNDTYDDRLFNSELVSILKSISM